MSQLDDFMAAIGNQESGGNYNASNPSGAQGKYQILASNWPSWAREAGLPANAPKTPANQERVARAKFQQYYDNYGSWEKVASAWYSGNPNLYNSNKAQPGGPSVAGYVQSVMSKMGGNFSSSGTGVGLGAGSGAGGDGANPDAPDPRKSMGYQLGNFLNILGGNLGFGPQQNQDPSIQPAQPMPAQPSTVLPPVKQVSTQQQNVSE